MKIPTYQIVRTCDFINLRQLSGGIFDFRQLRVGFRTHGVAFCHLAVGFWPSRFNFAFCESMLSLFESILGIWRRFLNLWEPILGIWESISGIWKLVSGLWMANLIIFFNFRPLEVNFWCLWVKLGTLGVVFRHMRVNFRPLQVDFGNQKLILALCDLSKGFEREIYLKFVVLGLLASILWIY